MSFQNFVGLDALLSHLAAGLVQLIYFIHSINYQAAAVMVATCCITDAGEIDPLYSPGGTRHQCAPIQQVIASAHLSMPRPNDTQLVQTCFSGLMVVSSTQQTTSVLCV